MRRLGTDGRRQHETRYKEELELVRHSNDLRFGGKLMCRPCYAEKSGDGHITWMHSKTKRSVEGVSEKMARRSTLYTCPCWKEVRKPDSRKPVHLGTKGQNFQERLEVARWN